LYHISYILTYKITTYNVTFIYQNEALDECYSAVCLTQKPRLMTFTNTGAISELLCAVVRTKLRTHMSSYYN